jgi:hypothetical protein
VFRWPSRNNEDPMWIRDEFLHRKMTFEKLIIHTVNEWREVRAKHVNPTLAHLRPAA